MVKLNVDRAVSTQNLDLGYLDTLTSDAVPELLSSSAYLARDQRTRVALEACKGDRHYQPPWAAFNLADSTAATIRREMC